MDNNDETKTGDGTEPMSFWGHLEALRWVLMRVVIALFVCMGVAFAYMPWLFENFVLAPTTSDFFLYRWLAGIRGDGFMMADFSDTHFKVELININVTSQFMTHITTALWMGVVAVFPYLVWQLWSFVKPALYPGERRNVGTAFLFGTLMFFLGCAVGYCLVFPFTFRFLALYQISPTITNQISLDSYMDNFQLLILVMGIVFELPLLAWLLGTLGVIDRTLLSTYRRHAVVVLLVLAAFITPTSDPFTLMVVFVPLYLLYEVSIRCVKKKR